MHPTAIATEFSGQTWTYQYLSECIYRVAAALKKRYVQPSDKLGVIVTNHPNTLVAMLAIWYIGAVYVPMDSKLPQQRQQYIIEAASCQWVLNATITPNMWPGALVLSELLQTYEVTNYDYTIHQNTPDDLAYIIFTSGSTGLPKGVMITHENINYHLNNPVFHDFQQAGTRVMVGVSPSFDV
ncbi:hypothetical protein BJ085DRAFT_23340, partial [Dimargaris cristalligena]